MTELFNRVERTENGHYWVEIDAHAARTIRWAIRYADRTHPWGDDTPTDVAHRLSVVLEDAAIHEETIEMELMTYERECIETAVNRFVGDFYDGIEDAKQGWYDFDEAEAYDRPDE